MVPLPSTPKSISLIAIVSESYDPRHGLLTVHTLSVKKVGKKFCTDLLPTNN